MIKSLFKGNDDVKEIASQVVAMRFFLLLFIAAGWMVSIQPNVDPSNIVGWWAVTAAKVFALVLACFVSFLGAAMFSYQAFDAVINERCYWLFWRGHLMALGGSVKAEDVEHLGIKPNEFIRLATNVVAVKSKSKSVLLRLYSN